jgi:hypothetical protein
MRQIIMSDWYFEGEEELGFAGREPAVLEFENDPVVAIANILAAGLIKILGPLFWGILILLFMFAEFTSH